MAFVCLVSGLEGPEVSIVHRVLRRHMDSPGDDPSGYHDRVLGLLGDILPYQYPTVEVPNTTFHLVGTPVRVSTPHPYVEALWSTAVTLQNIAPFVTER
jgi:hypothetical protein